MRKFQKATVVALSSAMVLSGMAACTTKKEEDKTTTAAPQQQTEAPKPTEGKTDAPTTEAPKRDLGGMNVVIGDWWSSGEVGTPEGKYEEALFEYREKIQKDNNFTIVQKAVGGWGNTNEGEIGQVAASSIQAGDPCSQIIVLDSSWVPGLLNNKMFFPLSTLPSFNFDDAKWNQGVRKTMTFGGVTYGMAVGHEPRLGLFFNKRLIEEAGYGADQIYDWQKNGEWTWTKFEELCNKLTKDNDADGVIDQYALCSFSSDFYPAAILSGGAEIVAQDESGHFVNGTTSQKFYDAMNWANEIYLKHNRPSVEGDNWDYFINVFNEGKAAMRVAEEYVAGQQLKDMDDDWGFVFFPSKEGEAMIHYDRENVLFIPSCIDAAEADKIAYAYNLYTNEVPGYEGGDNWKRTYYSQFRDTRAVDETLDMMRNGKNGFQAQAYVQGFSGAMGDGFIWSVSGGNATVAEVIEAKKPVFEQLIQEANEAVDKLGK